MESVNLATLWGLPVILVCENNGFAEFTPRSAHTNVERVADVVAPYGLDRETVDGNDVVAVREAFAAFLDAARSGGGPFLLECLTHRLRGHYEGDPQQYREALPQTSGRSSTRSCACSGAAPTRAGWRGGPRASSRRRATRSRRRSLSRARARSRPRAGTAARYAS